MVSEKQPLSQRRDKWLLLILGQIILFEKVLNMLEVKKSSGMKSFYVL